MSINLLIENDNFISNALFVIVFISHYIINKVTTPIIDFLNIVTKFSLSICYYFIKYIFQYKFNLYEALLI